MQTGADISRGTAPIRDFHGQNAGSDLSVSLTCNASADRVTVSLRFLDCARIHFLGVFWILPLVGVRRCLSRAEGLSLIPLRKNKRHTRRNASGSLN